MSLDLIVDFRCACFYLII